MNKNSYDSYLGLKIDMHKNGFLFSVNVYVFIPMVLLLWSKIVKNCEKWVYMGMGEVFFLEI